MPRRTKITRIETIASTIMQKMKKLLSFDRSNGPISGRGTRTGVTPPPIQPIGTRTFSNMSANASVASDR